MSLRLKLKIFIVIAVLILIMLTTTISVIPLEVEKTSLNNYMANSDTTGANFSYQIWGFIEKKEGNGTTLTETPFSYLNITGIGNNKYSYGLSIHGCSPNGNPELSKISGIQSRNGTTIGYFMGNLSQIGQFFEYRSLLLKVASRKTVCSQDDVDLWVPQNVFYINREVAIERLYVPLNINNEAILKNPSQHVFYQEFPKSMVGLVQSGSYYVLSYMSVKGGNFSLANKLLGTKDQVICDFTISLTRTNVKFNLDYTYYLIENINLVAAIWIVGVMFLVLTVRQVRKRIRKGGLNK